MTPPIPLYNPRSRQVSVVLMTGLLGAMMAFFTTLYLPGYGPATAVSDGRSLFLVARQRTPESPGGSFAFTRSKDGAGFTPMHVRSGAPAAAAAVDGELYCLFADGRLARLGESKDDWQPLRFNLKWSVRGLAVFDNALWAIGQERRHNEILTARLDNGTWTAGPTCAGTGDNVISVRGVQSGDRRLLFWSTMGGDVEARRYHIAGAGVEENELVPLPAFALDEASRFTAFAEGDGVDVFYWEADSNELPALSDTVSVHRVTFENGAWGAATPYDIVMGPGHASTRSVIVGRHADKTFLYGFRYELGLIYWGLYGVELRAGGPSEPFLVLVPNSDELQTVGAWTAFAVGVIFLTGGGLAGAIMLRRVESKSLPAVHSLYATVTDRALAAGFDVMLLYTLMSVIPGNWTPGEFWTSFLLAHIVYGVFTEAAGGQTLGKKVLGLRVLTADGAPVSIVQAFRRNAFKALEMLTVGVGSCLVTSRFQRPGDFLGGTVVIKEFRMPRQVEEGEGTEP
jgi:uncharacterized RDD family membrane protein YckC